MSIAKACIDDGCNPELVKGVQPTGILNCQASGHPRSS